MNNKNENQNFEDTINLKKYISAITFNIYRIIIIIIVGLAAWLYWYTSVDRVYKVSSLVQVDVSYQRGQLEYDDLLFGGRDDTSLQERMILYKSRSNITKLVNELGLNIYINSGEMILKENKPLDIDFFSASISGTSPNKSFEIQTQESGFDLIDLDTNKKYENLIWDKLNLADGVEVQIKNPLKYGESFNITFYDVSYTVDQIINKLMLSNLVGASRSLFTQGSLINVSYESSNIDLAKKIINTANKIYVSESVQASSLEAQKSLNYINEQIDIIGEQLTRDEKDLNQIRKDNVSLDIEVEAQSIIEQSALLEGKLKSLEIEIAEYEQLYRQGNPILDRALKSREILLQQIEGLNTRISLLPDSQQGYINLLRKVQVNQVIFEDLLSKQLEFSLLRASNLGDVKIIDKAFVERLVSPILTSTFLATFFLMLFIGVFYSVVRQLFFAGFTTPSEIINDYNASIIGVIPLIEDASINSLSNREKEAINSITTNIMLSLAEDTENLSKAKSIMVTAATAGCGKTLISELIGRGISELNKKVVIVDCDYKRGDIHKNFNVELGSEKSINRNLTQYKINENLYLIPRPKKLGNKSLTIFQSKDFGDSINFLKENFDYVIIDTPPVLSVSDSLLLQQHADFVIGVIRHDVTTRNEFNQLNTELSFMGNGIDTFVYNAFKKPRGYYGYDYYAYKYYDNSSYYDYEVDNK